ncbi:PE-PGRS family protein PE_PGRS12 [Mycobacterium tuberculosis variant africanum]|nr:PE-PGRS family protein PE_PGRS12 [Mycobacterium tuberculosis variant africanum]
MKRCRPRAERLKIPPWAENSAAIAADTSSAAAACTALVWAAATALAKLSAEPMRATSVAAVASVAGNTLT